MFRPPKNDDERMQNLLEALSEPGDGDDAFDEIIQAQLAKRGHTLETYAAQLAGEDRGGDRAAPSAPAGRGGSSAPRRPSPRASLSPPACSSSST